MVSRTRRAQDSRNPDLREIIDYMILENQGDFKDLATIKRVRQARQRA